MSLNSITSLELCAGGGGQALGLEQAGFEHAGLVEIERRCCATLTLNRPQWKVFGKSLREFTNSDAKQFQGIDLLTGGLPCPPFSVAGKQLGDQDERNLFPIALDIVDITRPKAVMIENVRGLLGSLFKEYRQRLKARLEMMGYCAEWQLLNASDFGVPQLRPRVVIVALRRELAHHFSWPTPREVKPKTVGETLFDQIASRGWRKAQEWKEVADGIAPTIVGGSLKHGGPDLGPTRARRAWAKLGVDGLGIAAVPPAREFVGMPRLTVPMVARLQGFPDEWQFAGSKTASYRQVGNAFPPPVARAVGERIHHCLSVRKSISITRSTE